MKPIEHPAVKAAIEAATNKIPNPNIGDWIELTLKTRLAPALEQLVADAVKAERERCAGIADALQCDEAFSGREHYPCDPSKGDAMTTPTDDDILRVAEFAGFMNAHRDTDGAFVFSSKPESYVVWMPPFWRSLDAWHMHVWPKLRATNDRCLRFTYHKHVADMVIADPEGDDEAILDYMQDTRSMELTAEQRTVALAGCLRNR